VVLGPQAELVAGEIRARLQLAAAVPAAPAVEAPAAVRTPQDRRVAEALLKALGEGAKVAAVSTCSSRLRLTLAPGARVDEAALVEAGARALARPAPESLHVILGPRAEAVAEDLRELLA
jgi:N-acetylglucosamine PTS system EIICBA or EIICB component